MIISNKHDGLNKYGEYLLSLKRKIYLTNVCIHRKII